MGYYRGDYYAGDYYQGDPFSLSGFLSGGLKAIGGLGIPGVSTLANVAGSILGGSSGTKIIAPATQQPILPPTFPNSGGFTGIQFGTPGGGIAIGTGQSYIGSQPGPGAPAMVQVPGVGLVPCAAKGTHLNKSTYYRNGQRIPKGTVCVKNRHMNVANGRALRRAIRRAEAFKKVAIRTVRFLNPTQKKKFGGFKKGRR